MREITPPPELVVYDGLEPCPYLPARVARMPLRFPLRTLTRSELDERLAAGDRRQGNMLYRTACPHCRACEPIRLDVSRFRPNRAQRRVYQRGERLFQVEIGPPCVDRQRVAMYNRHKDGRGLGMGDVEVGLEEYAAFLVDSCCETIELRYRIAGELVAIAVADRGESALSAVYCYFDPKYSALSPGTYSVLKEIEMARQWGMRHVYLGFYIGERSRMTYKGRYLPHERLIDGRWMTFER
jgi:arginine-tRNA-protein transferase